MSPAVYVQTNDSTDNEVIAFSRADDGALAPRGRYSTGGAGRVGRTWPRRVRSSSATMAGGCWW
jgi:hypothetical protein